MNVIAYVHMDAGNDFRGAVESGDALAVAAIGDIQQERLPDRPETNRRNDSRPASRLRPEVS